MRVSQYNRFVTCPVLFKQASNKKDTLASDKKHNAVDAMAAKDGFVINISRKRLNHGICSPEENGLEQNCY